MRDIIKEKAVQHRTESELSGNYVATLNQMGKLKRVGLRFFLGAAFLLVMGNSGFSNQVGTKPVERVNMEITSNNVGNLFFNSDRPLDFKLSLTASGTGEKQIKVKYKVVGWLGDVLEQGIVKTIVVPGKEISVPLTLKTTGKKGAFNILCSAMNGNKIIGEQHFYFGVADPALPEREKTTAKDCPFGVWVAYEGQVRLREIKANHNGYGGLFTAPTEKEIITNCIRRTENIAALLNQAGIKWTRINLHIPIPKANLSPAEERSYIIKEIQEYEYAIDIYRRQGIEPEGHLGNWKYMMGSKEDRERYSRYIFTIVDYLKDKVHVWCLVGEPDQPFWLNEPDKKIEGVNVFGDKKGKNSQLNARYLGGTPREYMEQLKLAYIAAKKADPACFFVTPAWTNDWGVNAMKLFYKLGGKGYFDAVGFDLYSAYFTKLNALKQMMQEHGDGNKKIWIGEIALLGLNYSAAVRQTSEKIAAADLVRTFNELLGETLVSHIDWFYFSSCRNTGLCLVTKTLQVKPIYMAYLNMTRRLGLHPEFIEKIISGESVLYCWKNRDKLVAAAWSRQGKETLFLKTKGNSITIYDLMGNVQKLPPKNGIVQIDLEEEMPCYIEQEGAGRLEVFKKVDVRINNAVNSPDQKPGLKVNVTNHLKQLLSGTLVLKSGQNYTVDHEKYDLSLVPGASRDFIFEIKGYDYDRNSKDTFTATVDSNAGKYVKTAKFNFHTCNYAVKAPVLDGTMDGWKAARPIRLYKQEAVRKIGFPDGCITNKEEIPFWQGKDDLSADLYTLWDKDNLYLSFRVKDDTFCQPYPKRRTFWGDGLQFSLQPEGNFSPQASFYEFDLALSKDGPVLWRHFPEEREEKTSRIFIKATGEKENMVYQAAIPWESIGVAKQTLVPGKLIGFAWLADDRDSVGRIGKPWLDHKFMEWFKGISYNKNPSEYGCLILVK